MPLIRLRRFAAASLACAALLAVPAASSAQRTVHPGSFVRILSPSAADSLLTGTVVEIDSASLLLAPSASARPRTVALRDIERLEVRGPGPRRTLTGALVGTVVGAVAGYAVCHAASGSPHANCPRAQASVLAGTVGMALGALLGSEFRGRDRWRPAIAPGW